MKRSGIVLVTGAAGRLGQAMLMHGLGGSRLHGADLEPCTAGVERCDITRSEDVAAALDGVQAVVHAAALHAPHVGLVSERRFMQVNVDATRRLYEMAAERGVSRFVFLSSTAVYGAAATPTGRAGWVDESLDPKPRTIYHRSKLIAEAWLQAQCRSGGPAVRILRVARCFPEPAHLMAVYRLHRGVDARDVARACAMSLGDTLGPFRRWIIAAPTPLQRSDVLELHADAATVLARRAPRLVIAMQRRGWPLPVSIDRVYDASRVGRELGWRARHGAISVLRDADHSNPRVLPPVAC
ncbi:NAD(P)-dependent oxidoreductase [Oleiagrimonas sp. C23AA]|nr:NAD(P)-dependent oxidoreductase [Oleiagrimonas sp. C23AA]